MKASETYDELKQINSNMAEVRKTLGEHSISLAQISLTLSNHLTHHDRNANWFRWAMPIGISILITVITWAMPFIAGAL